MLCRFTTVGCCVALNRFEADSLMRAVAERFIIGVTAAAEKYGLPFIVTSRTDHVAARPHEIKGPRDHVWTIGRRNDANVCLFENLRCTWQWRFDGRRNQPCSRFPHNDIIHILIVLNALQGRRPMLYLP